MIDPRQIGADQLAAMIEDYGITLKPTRRGDFWGLCPNHPDRRPTLHVYAAREDGRGRYHCFACGRDFDGDAGDWLRFVGEKPAFHAKRDPSVKLRRQQEKNREALLKAYRDLWPEATQEEEMCIETGLSGLQSFLQVHLNRRR